MRLRPAALTLALCLSLSLLSACGGKDASQQPGSSAPGSSVSTSGSQQPDASVPEAPLPGASAPDSSAPDASAPDAPASDGSQSGSSAPEQEPAPSLSLNKSDFTLFKVGDSYKLKATVSGTTNAGLSWSSSDESVATVSQDGTVTAVAPGTAVITVSASSAALNASCTVRCRFEADTPASGSSSGAESGSSSSGSGSSSSSGSGASSSVDLAAFREATVSTYEFSAFLQLADQEMTDAFYPGLSAISTQQCLVYATMMSMNNGEFVLVQVTDSKDVSAVKAILQARVDYMVDGGAWYPEPTRIWSEESRIVSNGNYVMMVVNPSCDSIVADFNALF